jgi:hypothetical protein
MTTEELTGTLVLVHPELKNDPAGKFGEIGVITGANIAEDTVYVGFGRAGQGAYGSDALLVLKPAEVIYKQMQEDKSKLSTNEYKTLFQIALMLEYKQSATTLKNAMLHAMKSETLRNYSMVTLDDALGLKRNQSLER